MPNYTFPQIYNFPPFFTRQPNEQTWHAQRASWIQLILGYSKANRVWILNNKGQVLSQGNVDEMDDNGQLALEDEGAIITKESLFANDRIQRSLSIETVDEIFSEMVKSEDAFYNDNHSSVFVNFYRPEDWAAMVLEWVESTGQSGGVLTMYEIANGELSASQEFHGIHPVILERALNVLVKRSRAQLLKDQDNRIAGVKIV